MAMNNTNTILGFRILNQLIFVSMAFFCILGCEFESGEVWYNDISEPVGEIPIAEFSFKDSIVFISQATQFEYSLSFTRQKVYLIEFYLDNRKFDESFEPDGSILIDPVPGKHIFEMVVFTSTASNSLADQIGYEVFSYNKSWTIYFESESISQIQNRAYNYSSIRETLHYSILNPVIFSRISS